MAQATRTRSAVDGPERDELVEMLQAELVALEGAVEELQDTVRTLRYGMGAVLEDIYGADIAKRTNITDYRTAVAAHCLQSLYPETRKVTRADGSTVELHESAAAASRWRRPKRRWTMYGTRAELLAIAAEHDVPLRYKTRESIIRALWKAGIELAPRPS